MGFLFKSHFSGESPMAKKAKMLKNVKMAVAKAAKGKGKQK